MPPKPSSARERLTATLAARKVPTPLTNTEIVVDIHAKSFAELNQELDGREEAALDAIF